MTQKKVNLKQDSLSQVKKAVQLREWIILYGGTRKERRELASIAHEMEIKCKHTGKDQPLEESFKRINLAGCPENEIYKSIVSELWLLRPEVYPREESISDPSSIARTIFFQNLLCDSDYAKSEIRKVAGQLGMMKDEISNLGTLVIDTTKESYDNLPDELKEIFLCIAVGEEAERIETDGKEIQKQSPSQDKLKNYIFRKEDELWFIKYENESFKLINTDGLKYMQHLLKNPYPNQFTPKQLYQEVNKTPKLPGEVEADIVDDETKELINKLKEDKEIAESCGNKAREEEIEAKINALMQEYVKKHLGSRGKSRKFPSSIHKKPYDVINNSRTRVLKKIEKLCNDKGYDSMLTWKHLENSIQYKDSHFYYNPDTPHNWQF